MTSAPDSLAARVQARLGELAERPFSLVCLLLLANALALPYVGFSHDSRLYAVQLVERLHPGSFGDDLYLRYGSQDRYSAFTLMMAPLVSVLGLKTSFFVVYLASKALFFWGLLRLIRVLIPDRVVAVFSLLCVALMPMPFGGNNIFHVNESFLTPRIASCGLVLLGLERMLAGRVRMTVTLLTAALVLHPLMAPAGVLTALAWWLYHRLSGRRLVGLLLALLLAAGMTLGCQPVGVRLFGHLDEEWRADLLEICFFIDMREWSAGDWARILFSLGMAAVAAGSYARSRAPFLLAVLATAVLGLAGSLLTLPMRYLLFYQVSPYRTLWLLEVLAVPLAFWGLAVLWRSGRAYLLLPLPGLALLAVHDWGQGDLLEVYALLATLPAAIVLCRGLGRRPLHHDWPRRTALAGLGASVLLLAWYNLLVLFLAFSHRPTFYIDTHPIQVLRTAPSLLYTLPELLAAALLASVLLRLLGPGGRFQLACLALALGYQTALYALDGSTWYGQHFEARHPSRAFVTAFVQQRARLLGRAPTVYWPTDLGTIWLQAGAHSYFNSVQLSGCGFNRGTALEGKRRARLARRFELSSMHRFPLPEPWWRRNLCRFYGTDEEEPPPTSEDLIRLCREEFLDLVVIQEAFDGLYCATDGRYYIYDCAQLRRLNPQHKDLPQEISPDTATAAAHPRVGPGGS